MRSGSLNPEVAIWTFEGTLALTLEIKKYALFCIFLSSVTRGTRITLGKNLNFLYGFF